eukprot:SAG22_NODE_14592_length_370_cov_1.321033_1_plen_29_part_01
MHNFALDSCASQTGLVFDGLDDYIELPSA